MKILLSCLIAFIAPLHAAILEQHVPVERESALYYVENVITNTNWSVFQQLEGRTVRETLNGKLITVYTMDDKGKEFLTDIVGNSILTKISLNRPISQLEHDEVTFGNFDHFFKGSTGLPNFLIKSQVVKVVAKKVTSNVTVYVYELEDNGKGERELKVEAFEVGKKLPIEITFQKFKKGEAKPFSHIFLIRQ